MLWLRTDEAKAEIGIPPELTLVSAFCLGYAASIPDTPPRQRPAIIWKSG
jgi:hypothetical protein